MLIFLWSATIYKSGPYQFNTSIDARTVHFTLRITATVQTHLNTLIRCTIICSIYKNLVNQRDVLFVIIIVVVVVVFVERKKDRKKGMS